MLRELRDSLRVRTGLPLPELSMGMAAISDAVERRTLVKDDVV